MKKIILVLLFMSILSNAYTITLISGDGEGVNGKCNNGADFAGMKYSSGLWHVTTSFSDVINDEDMYSAIRRACHE